MMQANKILFFSIVSVAVVAVAGLFSARLLLVNRDPVELTVLYSTEKEAWLEQVSRDFQGQIGGRPIQLKFEPLGSQEIVQAVLDGTRRPHLISPASSLQISMLAAESGRVLGAPVVNLADATACRSVVKTPLVLVAWQDRAEALGWLDSGDPDLWTKLRVAVADPDGWRSHGHANWGYVKFGQTDPNRSNSGLMTLLLITYDYFDKSTGLTNQDLLSPDFDQWFQALGEYTDVGDSTGTFMKEMVTFGPSRYDLVAVYESTAIEQIPNAAGRYGELRVYYPSPTVLSDHPFCLLQADWVTADEAAAAEQFVTYLLDRPAQEAALALGFRPADAGVALDGPGSPFSQYTANGIRTDLPAQVDVPPGEVLTTLINFWNRHQR
ncbi:MAG TPA: substrate-binding domain-containing protein [Anaerolineae bacterium]|nr:substrate-binding domain-containing protein [Anaerolineae bacterium]